MPGLCRIGVRMQLREPRNYEAIEAMEPWSYGAVDSHGHQRNSLRFMAWYQRRLWFKGGVDARGRQRRLVALLYPLLTRLSWLWLLCGSMSFFSPFLHRLRADPPVARTNRRVQLAGFTTNWLASCLRAVACMCLPPCFQNSLDALVQFSIVKTVSILWPGQDPDLASFDTYLYKGWLAPRGNSMSYIFLRTAYRHCGGLTKKRRSCIRLGGVVFRCEKDDVGQDTTHASQDGPCCSSSSSLLFLLQSTHPPIPCRQILSPVSSWPMVFGCLSRLVSIGR